MQLNQIMKKNSFEISSGIDWVLVGVYVALVLIGITSIFATTYRDENIIRGFFSLKTDYSKQSLFFLISAVLAVLILLTDSKFFTATANIFYFRNYFIDFGFPISYRCKRYKIYYPFFHLSITACRTM